MNQVDGLSRLLDVQARFSTHLTALPTLADGGALQEMLLCLISNSLKAIGRGGEIELELEQRGNKAVLTLRDNGKGMDAETLAALFDPPEDSAELPEGAAGLGLPLARQIATLHGGILIVDSQEHKGGPAGDLSAAAGPRTGGHALLQPAGTGPEQRLGPGPGGAVRLSAH